MLAQSKLLPSQPNKEVTNSSSMLRTNMITISRVSIGMTFLIPSSTFGGKLIKLMFQYMEFQISLRSIIHLREIFPKAKKSTPMRNSDLRKKIFIQKMQMPLSQELPPLNF